MQTNTLTNQHIRMQYLFQPNNLAFNLLKYKKKCNKSKSMRPNTVILCTNNLRNQIYV